jgi:hypothetical protein
MTAPRTPTLAPFPTDPVLTGIVIAYKNPAYIADQVLPRVPVGAMEFRYLKYAKGDAFTLPETKVGRRSRPNTTEFGATEEAGFCAGYGLDAEIPRSDVDGAARQRAQFGGNYDPVNHHTMMNRDLIMLGREKRTADLVFTAGNYPAGNKVTLAGNDRWSINDPASDPIQDIESAKDAMIMTPNIGVIGRKAWRYLKTHPVINKALNRDAGDKGIATRRAVADLFELQDIYIGESFVNTAKRGQAEALARVWGPHMALLYINPNANNEAGITFGFTAQSGGPIAGQWEDKDIGLEGGVRTRTGENVKELISAADCGYLITNCGDDS